jgi:hypothetical protein
MGGIIGNVENGVTEGPLMSEAHTEHSLSIHRSEALADAIYAVETTLLVIELKLPETPSPNTQTEVSQAPGQRAERAGSRSAAA